MTKILLITNKGDITTDFVVSQLSKRNNEFYRLNTEDLFHNVSISFDFHKSKFTLYDVELNIEIDLTEIKSVYYRRPLLPDITNRNLTNGESNFIISEINNTLEGLYKILKNTFWISPVYAIREAESKIFQLQIAKELGFNIAPSIITNQIGSAQKFLDEFRSVIKPIKTGLIQDIENERVIFTSIFKDYDELDRIEFCPTYFQKFIDKVADVRVTVVGDKVFSALILSQEYNETKVDWRMAENLKLNYKKIELPESLTRLCIALTKKLGLNFGAIDFVEDALGNYIFLEINPNGQWAWIERQLDYNISFEIANLLNHDKY